MTSSALISLPKPLISLTTTPTPHHRRRGLRTPSLIPCKTSSDGNNNATTTNGGNPTPPVVSPPRETVEIRFRRGSRKRSRKQQQQEQDGGGAKKSPAVEAAKDWESMSLGEKAMELYVGEKGLLFWLNKFAYASIFIIIGAWILFRFVGPALNLYQLDSAPLSPTSLLKG